VNKSQLVDSLSEIADLPKAKAAVVLDTVLEQITQALVEGEPVVLVGFGTFSVKKRAARVGRDPRTGGTLQIPAAVVANFKAGKALKDAVNLVKEKEAVE
jgi:DNA-binding protein HU-beta